MTAVRFSVSHSLDGLRRISDARLLCTTMEWEVDNIEYGQTKIDKPIRDIVFHFVNADHAALFKLTWMSE